ncbi:hypothetical protein PsYK624_152130 [Phanerochaete sordida]|uniref:RING-type E3 ubiquitin transferase n=1 Tax=Phanerochaete sordida TaxID=48140 RepID=A0A9P3GNX8_9APHY|nr:hypothetical protein PsYK624_152130 [Phanerochaete sordida]
MTTLPVVYLLCLSLVFQANAHPVDWFRKLSTASRQDASWLWSWAWAADGTVSVVDRSPPLVYPARPASFGRELTEPLLGYVIPLSAFTSPCAASNSSYPFVPDPVQGCPDLCVVGPNQPEQSETWIAFVQRGGCPFVEKARQAQSLGAKAIVVGGDRENPDALLNMYSEKEASDVTIAATFIKYWDYAELTALIAASNTSHSGLRTVSLLLNTEYSAWEWYSPIITFVIILLLPSILTFITLLIHRIRAARAARRDRAPEHFVHSLPWRVWTGNGWEKHDASLENAEDPSEDPSSGPDRDLERGPVAPSCSRETSVEPPWVDEQMECAICLDMFAKGDRVRVLPCNHLFHMNEIDEWLITKKKVCPICKADITKPRPTPQHEPSQHDPSVQSPLPSPSTPQPPTERSPLLPH